MALMNISIPLPGTHAEKGTAVVAVPRRRPRWVVAVLRQGVLGYVGALAISWGLVQLHFGLPADWTFGVVSVVAAWLLYSFAALPAFERARSFKPSIRLIAALGVAVLAGLLTGVNNSSQLRHAVTATLAAPALLAASALVHRHLLRRTPTVLVGQASSVERLASRWASRPDVDVVATCSWVPALESVPALGSPAEEASLTTVEQVLAAVEQHRATSVVIASGQAFTNPALRQLAWGLQRAEVECLVVADLSDHVEYLRPRRVGDQIAMSLRAPNDHLMSLAAKSVMDRVIALLALIVLSPLLLVLAATIRLGSRGPAVFRQVRAGRDGKPFTIWKFRTMVVDAEDRLDELRCRNEGAGPLFKLRDDPRITRLGAFLRTTSLDELPQLLNVLRGDMSLVGPRPALLTETAQYDALVRRRLHVKPGLTGLWQVSGRSSLSWEESIRMDLQYVNNWNLRLDLSILVRTVRAVLTRDGAH